MSNSKIGKENIELIASNLTIAFYNSQIRREPFLGEERRNTFYSPDESERVPTVSMKEVHSVFEQFCKMIERK